MIVHVLAIRDPTTVLLSALGTTMVGLWRGDAAPALGPLSAELEFASRRWSDVRVVGPCTPSTRRGEVEAIVLDYDYDGVATLASEEAQLMLELDDDPPLGVVGRTIRFEPGVVEVFPYDL
jgi:hypothetical protein